MNLAARIVGALALALLLSGAFTGCTTTREVEVVKTVAVETPVYSCPAIEIKRPVFAVDSLPLGADIFTQSKHLRADRLQRKAYINELEAVLRQRNASAAQ